MTAVEHALSYITYFYLVFIYVKLRRSVPYAIFAIAAVFVGSLWGLFFYACGVVPPLAFLVVTSFWGLWLAAFIVNRTFNSIDTLLIAITYILLSAFHEVNLTGFYLLKMVFHGNGLVMASGMMVAAMISLLWFIYRFFAHRLHQLLIFLKHNAKLRRTNNFWAVGIVFFHRTLFLIAAIAGIVHRPFTILTTAVTILLAIVMFQLVNGQVMTTWLFAQKQKQLQNTFKQRELLAIQAVREQQHQKYEDKLEQINLKYRRERHDLQNMLLGLAGTISERDFVGANNYLSALLKTTPKDFSISEQTWTGLGLVQIAALKQLLFAKLTKAAAKNIPCTFEITEPLTSVPTAPITLARIIGILCDNAIEASHSMNQPQIHIAFISYSDNTTSFAITNRTNGPIDLTNALSLGASTKNDHDGFGLANVADLIKNDPHLTLTAEQTSHHVCFELFMNIT